MPTGYVGRTTAPSAEIPKPTGVDAKAVYDWALRFITWYRRRERRFTAGIVSLATSGTSTVVSDAGIVQGDVVVLSPMNSAALTAGAFVLEANVDNGAFGITHTADAAARRLAYIATPPSERRT